MSKEAKDHVLIPALITAAAVYFGVRRKSENIGEIAKDLVNRAVKDQVRKNHKSRQAPRVKATKRRSKKFKYLTLRYENNNH